MVCCPLFKSKSELHLCFCPSQMHIPGLETVKSFCSGARFFCFFFYFSFLVWLSYCWHHFNPSASKELDWSGANFTLYSIYTNTLLCCSLFPSASLLELFQYPETCARKQTNNNKKLVKMHSVCLCNSHIRLLTRWGTPYHIGTQITFQSDGTFTSCSGVNAEELCYTWGHPFQSTVCHHHLSCVF